MSAVEALTSVTAKEIEGNRPLFVSTIEAENKIGFTLDGQFYSEYDDNIKGAEIKEFDGKYTLNDFIISDKLAANLSETSNYSDIDGDEADLFDIKLESYSWSDASGKTISSADYSKIIGCGSGYSMPLTLQINQQVRPNSQYGIPREGIYSTFTKTYQIASKSEVCYARPNSSIVRPYAQWITYVSDTGKEYWNQSGHNRDPMHGGGITSDYILNLGFKVNPNASSGKKFPTTGFPGAKFQLLMTGAQTDYDFSIISQHGSDIVSVDNQGFVLLKNKPLGNVTVRAILKRDKSVTHDYSFNPSTVWIVPQGTNYVNWSTAISMCNGIQNIPTLAMYTNSPQNNPSRDMDLRKFLNTFTRAIGGGVFAEWGYADIKAYPESQWGSFSEEMDGKAYYWSSNLYMSGEFMFVGDARAGNVNNYPVDYKLLVACVK